VHTFYQSEIANQLALNAAFQLSRRTTMVLAGSASQSTLNNILLNQPSAAATTTLLPSTSTTVVTANVGEGLTHELSPRVFVDQQATAIAFTTLAPSLPFDTLSVTLGGGVEHVWKYDGLGLQATVGYSTSRTLPPTPPLNNFTAALAPRWRHDWSPSVTSLVAAGAAVLVNPDTNEPPIFAPSAQGTVSYVADDTTFEVTASTGFTPNALTGQTVRAHQGSVRGVTPVLRRARLYAGGSVGYVRGTLLDSRVRANDYDYDSVFSGADLVWQATPILQVYARYTFTGQVGEATLLGLNPSFLRESLLVGIALSSEPVDATAARGGRSGGAEGTARLPQRVDRSDAPIGGKRDEKPTEGDGATRRPPPQGIGGSPWNSGPNAPPPQRDDDDD
jgi:hypothetical protein